MISAPLLLSSDFIKNSVLAFNKLSLSAGYALTIFSQNPSPAKTLPLHRQRKRRQQ
jgi:hypothetical protein